MQRRYLLDGGAGGNDGAGVAGDSQKMLDKCEDAVQNVHEFSILSVARLWGDTGPTDVASPETY